MNTKKTQIARLDRWLESEFVKYFLLMVTVILAGLYIWQINTSATYGYIIRDLEKEIAAIERQNERLEQKVAKLQSVDSVTNRVKMLGLVKIENVKYIVPEDNTSVALGK